MNHTPDPELLSAYLDGELSLDQRAEVERHLAGDPGARQLLDDLRMLSSTLHSLPQQRLGDDLSQRVLQTAERQMLNPRHDPDSRPVPVGQFWGTLLRRFLQPRAVAWTAAILLVAAALTIFDPQRQARRQVAQAPGAAVQSAPAAAAPINRLAEAERKLAEVDRHASADEAPSSRARPTMRALPSHGDDLRRGDLAKDSSRSEPKPAPSAVPASVAGMPVGTPASQVASSLPGKSPPHADADTPGIIVENSKRPESSPEGRPHVLMRRSGPVREEESEFARQRPSKGGPYTPPTDALAVTRPKAGAVTKAEGAMKNDRSYESQLRPSPGYNASTTQRAANTDPGHAYGGRGGNLVLVECLVGPEALRQQSLEAVLVQNGAVLHVTGPESAAGENRWNLSLNATEAGSLGLRSDIRSQSPIVKFIDARMTPAQLETSLTQLGSQRQIVLQQPFQTSINVTVDRDRNEQKNESSVGQQSGNLAFDRKAGEPSHAGSAGPTPFQFQSPASPTVPQQSAWSGKAAGAPQAAVRAQVLPQEAQGRAQQEQSPALNSAPPMAQQGLGGAVIGQGAGSGGQEAGSRGQGAVAKSQEQLPAQKNAPADQKLREEAKQSDVAAAMTQPPAEYNVRFVVRLATADHSGPASGKPGEQSPAQASMTAEKAKTAPAKPAAESPPATPAAPAAAPHK